mmetsp:Transcript_80731/g.224732  ORF Transcript_80731/g.224732 Transcript_80731/m.224732 type:complete len:249 (-) Transcript_80731:4-750(-)
MGEDHAPFSVRSNRGSTKNTQRRAHGGGACWSSSAVSPQRPAMGGSRRATAGIVPGQGPTTTSIVASHVGGSFNNGAAGDAACLTLEDVLNRSVGRLEEERQARISEFRAVRQEIAELRMAMSVSNPSSAMPEASAEPSGISIHAVMEASMASIVKKINTEMEARLDSLREELSDRVATIEAAAHGALELLGKQAEQIQQHQLKGPGARRPSIDRQALDVATSSSTLPPMVDSVLASPAMSMAPRGLL